MNAVVERADELRRGREAYATRAWLDAYTALSEADRIAPLDAADLDLLANSASLVGRMDEYLTLLERAHLAHIEGGDSLAAAGSAGWLGMGSRPRGRSARRAVGSPGPSVWSSERGEIVWSAAGF